MDALQITQFTVGERIQLREALRDYLQKQAWMTINSEFNMGRRHEAARKSVRDTHSALTKVLEYQDDGEGLGFKDPDIHEFLNEVSEERGWRAA